MLLVIDCGNTNTVFAIYQYEENNLKLLNTWRIYSDTKRTSDDYFIWIKQVFFTTNLNINDLKGIAIASVVPEVLLNIKLMIRKYFKLNTLIFGEDKLDLDFEINIDNPQDAGADRLLNAYAVKVLKYNPAIVIDFGTATTFDIVGEKGSYEGGIIAPGINLSVDALYRSTSRLPKITVKSLEDENKTLVGKNTISAMESGIYWGYVCMIDGLIYKLKKIYKDSKIIATGGLTAVFKKDLSSIDVIEKNLTIFGLAQIYLSQFKLK